MGASSCKSFSPKKVANERNKSTNAGKSEKLDYIEGVVCNEKDINENEMKLLPLGDDSGKILLIKQNGELHALGTKCTHYGALLHTGVLGQGRVRCPWHGACFNIKTGDIEDYPGLDSLPCYKVSVDENGLVSVRAKRKDLEANRRTKEMCEFNSENVKTAVIVGGGPAGATCAESLRQEGFTGNIVMVCKEPVLPYDRVKVSKTMDFDIEKALLRPQFFYNEHRIETKLGVEATGLNVIKKIVKLSNDEELQYDYLFIATGSKPRRLNVPGANLANVFVMRNYSDSASVLRQLSYEKHVVVLGLSFIGMEAAAYCVNKCASVTVIGRDTVPFRPVFGLEIGERVKREFEKKGVRFIFESSIIKFIPKDDNKTLKEIELLDGTVLPADLAIMGIGSTLHTNWLEESSIQMREDGSIVTDKYLKTNIDNIYAGGDIAYAPVHSSGDVPACIGHFPLAHYHGKIAALNICGKETSLKSVPFFWTTLFGKSYRYAGHGNPTNIKIHGSLEDFKFFAYYFKNGKVIAMSSVGRDPIVSNFANLLYEDKYLTEEKVEKDPFGWMLYKPKDMLQNCLLDKPEHLAPENNSNGVNFENPPRRAYHTLALTQSAPYSIRKTKRQIFYSGQFLKYFKYFHVF